MKASLKFREDKKPVIRAKVPINIIGFPFQSGIVAGETKELTLTIATFFKSGPTMKFSYRPNDTSKPFSVAVKTGTGQFGSPIASSMVMSADFNLLDRGNPSFMLHFKPCFGDFSVRKSHSSSIKAIRSDGSDGSDDDLSIEIVESPSIVKGASKKITAFPSPAISDISMMLSGMEIAARTEVPVRGRAVVNFRWGVRLPTEMKTGDGGYSTSEISFRKIPYLVMNKIGIEHVDGVDIKESKTLKKPGPGPDTGKGLESGNSDIAAEFFSVNRKVEILQSENGMLKRSMEELRREITDRKSSPVMSTDSNFSKSSYNGKMVEGDVSEELKSQFKAFLGITQLIPKDCLGISCLTQTVDSEVPSRNQLCLLKTTDPETFSRNQLLCFCRGFPRRDSRNSFRRRHGR